MVCSDSRSSRAKLKAVLLDCVTMNQVQSNILNTMALQTDCPPQHLLAVLYLLHKSLSETASSGTVNVECLCIKQNTHSKLKFPGGHHCYHVSHSDIHDTFICGTYYSNLSRFKPKTVGPVHLYYCQLG